MNAYGGSNEKKIEEILRAFRGRSLPLLNEIEPAPAAHQAGNKEEIQKGIELLTEGKVGVLVLAGGQGTRLGWPGPKGTFPITPIRRKSLFQLLLERRKAASQFFGKQIPLAVMVSKENEQETLRHFEELGEQVDCFCQEDAPFLTVEGEPMAAQGPAGNGEVLRHFVDSGLYKKWKTLGIECIQLVQIDNPLADPFDPNLCGYHTLSGADVTLKCIRREAPEERWGVVGQQAGKLKVIEYSELPSEEWALWQGNHLKWEVAHIGLYCFSGEFVERAAELVLPWHFASKVWQGQPVYKCEHFIFDLLEAAHAPRLIVYPRQSAYAALKNAEGPQSPETVRQALVEADRRRWKAISGQSRRDLFELDPQFYYPTPEILKQWRGRCSNAPYVEP